MESITTEKRRTKELDGKQYHIFDLITTVIYETAYCQICKEVEPAEYDAKIKGGPWAFMCKKHFEEMGVGLGMGKGQKLILGKK